MKKKLNKSIVRLLLRIVSLYQKRVSPYLPHLCRHTPSCSEYMKQAIIYHGIVRGCSFGLMRLIRCSSFCRGGKDDVPILYHSYFCQRTKLEQDGGKTWAIAITLQSRGQSETCRFEQLKK